MRGIVDSDTLPLQVSRENLQQHAALKTMKKKLVRKTLDMIRRLADAETEFQAEDADSKNLARPPSPPPGPPFQGALAENCSSIVPYYTVLSCVEIGYKICIVMCYVLLCYKVCCG